MEEKVLSRFFNQEGAHTLAFYLEQEGYQAARKALKELTPEQILEEVKAANLRGRGGAGFPAGVKWGFVPKDVDKPKYLCVNADEGEPGCFKDRALMDHDPHAVIEGMVLAGFATGAPRGIIYLRYEYPETFRVLGHALHEAEALGFLGDGILGSDFSFHIHLRRGGGSYVCGEETSLLNSLEGKHPFPRNRPPYPVTKGFEDLPTVVNNVETLATVPHVLERGAEWYRDLGLNGLPFPGPTSPLVEQGGQGKGNPFRP